MIKIFANYIKNNFGIIRPVKAYYYCNISNIDSLYYVLMKNSVIYIKAESIKEAKILDVILNILIDNDFKLFDNYTILAKERINEFNLFLDKNLFTIINLLGTNVEPAFKYYMMKRNNIKAENFRDILSKLDLNQKWDARNWLQKFIKNNDLIKFDIFYPHEEEKQYSDIYMQFSNNKISIIDDEIFYETVDDLDYQDTFDFIIKTNNNLQQLDKKRKPLYKEITFNDETENLYILTPKSIFFDRKDIIKLLNMELSSSITIRIEQIFSIKD